MMTKFCFPVALALFLFGCGAPDSPEREELNKSIRLDIAVRETIGTSVLLDIINNEEWEVCFSAGDIRPGQGRTSVESDQGEILNDDGNPALEILRGVNVSEPIQVVRARQRHSLMLDLTEYYEQNRLLVLRLGVAVFRCSDLFDSRRSDVPRQPINKVFRISGGTVVDAPPVAR